jgi:hypothetical protein
VHVACANLRKRLTQGEIEKTQAAIAKRKGVSRRSIGHARRVYRIGDPAVQDAVADRLISMSDASEIVEEPSDVQQKAIALVRGKTDSVLALKRPINPVSLKACVNPLVFSSIYRPRRPQGLPLPWGRTHGRNRRLISAKFQ